MAKAPSREPTSVRKCPICGRPRDPKYNPFCSRRCADVDLGRWLKGNYVIAGDERSDRIRPSDEDE